jgi:uncharacterized protein YndB with AHSA1/START domain
MNYTILAAIAAARAGQPPLSGHAESLPTAFTALLTLAAPRDRVFAELADIENLPRWAGNFCEQVYVRRGRWAALTSLGELFLSLDANEATGEITLWAGWTRNELRALPMVVAATPEGETTVRFAVPRVADEDHGRLCRALCDAWPGLFARLDRLGLLGTEWRSN